MASDCELKLCKAKRKYYPGDFLDAQCSFKLNSPQIIRGKYLFSLFLTNTSYVFMAFSVGIVFGFFGTAKTEWVVKHLGQEETASGTESCSMQYKYLSFKEDCSPHELAAGNYVFPVRFLLPETLPSTFRSQFGSIQYHLNATIIRPNYELEEQAKVDVNIISELDKNQNVMVTT